MELSQKQEQKQILSQAQIQSVEMLQMNAMELTEFLKEAALENPVMELEEAHGHEEKTSDELQMEKLNWLAQMDEQNRGFHQYDRDVAEEDPMDRMNTEEGESLEEILMQQLNSGHYSREQMGVFRYIAMSLDERGFYTESLSDAANFLHVTEAFFQSCLEIMKELEPRGVCSADVSECLGRQLEYAVEDAGYELEQIIVADYLEALGKNQLPAIAKSLKVSVERIAIAKNRISQLQPIPARGYQSGQQSHYIVPDVAVVKFEEDYQIYLNDKAYPAIRMNKDYLRMYEELQRKKSQGGEDVESGKARTYLENKVKQVLNIQDNVTRRNDTLTAVTKCIIDHQSNFFATGDKALAPLRMAQLAEELSLHESTISRAVKEKYLQCCWGCYPLSYFFATAVGGQGRRTELHNHLTPQTPVDTSTQAAKEQLRILIAQEDKKKPYNDEKLALLLTEQGIAISRRTVVKYRENMGIPNSRGRKEF